MTIEEGADYKTMTFEGLMGKLKAFEEQQKQLDKVDEPQSSTSIVEVKKERPQKNLAFKAIAIEEENSSERDEDVDVALLTRGFNKFLRFNKKSVTPRGMA